MKRIVIKTLVVIFLLGMSEFLTAQTEKNKPIDASEQIIGVWNQAHKRAGKVLRTGNYKIINSDGNFYSMVVWRYRPTTMVMSGTYQLSDSTYTEHIKKHGLRPSMNGTKSILKYKFLAKDTLITMYNNEVINKWVPELWIRVQYDVAPGSQSL